MAYEHRPDSGSIFPNDRKTKDTQPDWRGSALIDGVDYWVSLWFVEKNGKQRASLRFNRKDESSDGEQSRAASPRGFDRPQNASPPAESRQPPPTRDTHTATSDPQQRDIYDDDIPF